MMTAVGRVLSRLEARGGLREPLHDDISARKGPRTPPGAVRKALRPASQLSQTPWTRGTGPAVPCRGVLWAISRDVETAPFNQSLLEGENAYNTVRPHRSLEGLTPAKYLHQRHPDLVPVQPSHM